ncbi:MAG: hypothetical protein ACRD88_17735, partial [Terriglobia bacterium]
MKPISRPGDRAAKLHSSNKSPDGNPVLVNSTNKLHSRTNIVDSSVRSAMLSKSFTGGEIVSETSTLIGYQGRTIPRETLALVPTP